MSLLNKVDVWNDLLNVRIQGIRSRVYRPLLIALTHLGVTANIVTNFRLVLGFLFLWLFQTNQLAAAWLMFCILFLDTVDGALARYQRKASDRGKFLDMFADYLIYTFTVLTFLWFPHVSVTQLVVSLIAVPSAYLLGTLVKGEGIETDWIIKPYPRHAYLKVPVATAFFLLIWFHVDFLNLSLVITNFASAALTLYYYIKLQLNWIRE